MTDSISPLDDFNSLIECFHFKLFIKDSPHFMVVTDLDLSVVLISDAFLHYVSPKADLVNLAVLFEQATYDSLKTILPQLLNRSIQSHTFQFVTTDYCSYQPAFKVVITPFASSALTVKHLLFSFYELDITQSEHSSTRLAISDWASIFETNPNGVNILTKDGVILDVNEVECNMLGYSKEYFLGKQICHFHKEGATEARIKYFHSLVAEDFIEFSDELRKSNGEIISVKRRLKTIRDVRGEVKQVILHTLDLTLRLFHQNQLHTLHTALDQSSSMLVMTDLEGKITYVNKRFETNTGYEAQEVLGMYPSIIKSKYLPSEVYAKLWQTIKSGKIWKGRFHNIRKNGTFFWEEATISPIRNVKDEMIGFLKASQDVTELVTIEKELIESNSRYHYIFDIVPTPIVIVKDSKVLDVNSAAMALAKVYNKEDLIGQDALQFVHPKYHSLFNRITERLQDTLMPFNIQNVTMLNSSGEQWVVEAIATAFNYKGSMASMYVMQDVTDRQRWISQLRESESKFKIIFNAIPDSVTISRVSDGLFIDANQAFSLVSGYSLNEVIGKTIAEINIYEDVVDRLRLVDELRTKGEVDQMEITFRTKSGVLLVTIVSARLIDLMDEKCILLVAHDITQRKNTEQELLFSKQIAEQNDKLKSAFLANMSHEIRTPMNAIIGFSDLLKEEGLSRDEQSYYIDIIQSKGDELMLLINDIIDISKIESGALELDMVPIQLNVILDNLRKNFESLVEKKSESKVIFKVQNIEDHTVNILADSYRLNQVFNNLIGNAIKFTPQGEIRVTVDIFDQEVSINVIDTGIGIDSNKIDSIFDRFSQVNHREDTLIGGTGLGLSITKNLILLMGGSIKVESKLSKGSIFTISLKRILHSGSVQHSHSHFDLNLDLSEKKIVIFDDDHAGLVFLETLIKPTKANYISFNNFDLAKQHVQELDSLDVFIMNMNRAVNQSIKSIQSLKMLMPNLFIIGLSADLFFANANKAEDLGYDGFLSKPFTKGDLYILLRKLFAKPLS
jgi:PAS domain S-box-containing protein